MSAALIAPPPNVFWKLGSGLEKDFDTPERIFVTPPEVPVKIVILKDLTYDKYTLSDTYMYGKTERRFQWDKIKDSLQQLEQIQRKPVVWAVVKNYKNLNGVPPLTSQTLRDDYQQITDRFGTERTQSIPLYYTDNLNVPDRYISDGTLVQHISDTTGFVKISLSHYYGEWYVPQRYVKVIGPVKFDKTIFVDRKNQNITLLERSDTAWLVRSMNPATTGLHHPPYQHETPTGTFVLQEKRLQMLYYVDGTTELAGLAPYANRFTDGAYIHGVPVNNPEATESQYIEFSPTLGTTPRSHMCVRNATSHAKYVYDWAPTLRTIIFVID